MSLRNKAKSRNAFEAKEVSPEELDAESYQSTRPSNPELNTGRLTGKPTDIFNIWADVKQPRRVVPGLIRLHWNGDPLQVDELLSRWQQVAEQKAGQKIPLVDMLNGRGEGFAEEDGASHPYVEDFIKLLRLAQSVHTDGLINPITVIKQGAKYVIEGGERRWLAYHLLTQHIDKKYEKIPAIEGNAEDALWRQAHENNNRDSLNAIAKARQLALLIMDLRRNMNDYQTYDELVVECDRIFYEQVANGRIHSIPSGMGERVESAMGLTIARVNQYRSLLRLTEDNAVNDILWMRASDEWWAEGFMRDVAKLPLDTLRGIVLSEQDWTANDLRAAIESTIVDSSGSHNSGDTGTKPTPIDKKLLTKGVIIQRDMGDYWQIEDIFAGGNTFYCASPTGYKMQVAYDKITAIANDKADLFKTKTPPAQSDNQPRPSLDMWFNVRVQSPNGQIGVVKGVNGASLRCRMDSGDMFDVLPSEAIVLSGTSTQPETRVSVDVKTGKVSNPPTTGEQQVSLYESADGRESDTAGTPKPTVPADKFGLPLLQGATVKTRVGRSGRVTGYNGRHVTVEVNGLRTDHAPDTLEVVPTDTFIPTPEEKQFIESFEDGDRVQLSCTIGDLNEFSEGTVKVWEDGERGVHFDGVPYYTSRVKVAGERSHILLWCSPVNDEDFSDDEPAEDATSHGNGTRTETLPPIRLFDTDTRQFLLALARAAQALGIQEYVIIEDLYEMDYEKLQRTVGNIGIAAIDRMIVNYSTMTKEILGRIENRFNDHLQRVQMTALEISKGDK